MFNLLNMFRRKKRTGIFRYWDGFRYRYADPIEIEIRIHQHPTCNFPAVCRVAQRGFQKDAPESHVKESMDAMSVLIPAIKQVFEIPDFNHDTGRGLTAHQIIELFGRFDDLIVDLKKNILA